MNPWRKFFLFTGVVIFPAVMVGYANYNVFPDSYFLATFMLGSTVLIAAIFTWKSRDATQKVQQYCVLADVALALVLTVNLGGHWLLAREHSAAKQGLAERHDEQAREEKLRDAETARQLQIAQANADLVRSQTAQIQAESRRLSRLPVQQRHSVLSAPQMTAPSVPSFNAPTADDSKSLDKPARLTPDQVIAKFTPFLTWMSFVDCFTAVFLGALLFAFWEMDKNHNGIPDHLETPQYQALPPAQTVIPVSQPRPYFSNTRKK